jgi:sigma-B regulation protein RsbU (phosphoserine phosphatase)
MMMTLVKGIIHSIAHQFTSPDRSLAEINSILSRIAPKQIFITMMFLVFDLKKKVLLFSNAGHNPLLYCNSQTKISQLIELKGCALNLMKSCSYSLKEIPFQQDDFFLIYTDGITEAMNKNQEMFGEARLTQTVSEVATESPSKVIDQIKARLFEFTEKSTQADDVLMIAIKIR